VSVLSVDLEHELAVAAAIEHERRAWTDVNDLIDATLDRAAEARLERIGDGCGGGLIEAFTEAVAARFGTAPEPVHAPELDIRRDSRRTRRKGLPPLVTARVFARDGLACVFCGAERELTVDHRIAIVNGGDALENLQTLCRPCNSAKGAR